MRKIVILALFCVVFVTFPSKNIFSQIRRLEQKDNNFEIIYADANEDRASLQFLGYDYLVEEEKKKEKEGGGATWVVAVSGLIAALAALVSAIATLLMALK
jgi:hypothetical protein